MEEVKKVKKEIPRITTMVKRDEKVSKIDWFVVRAISGQEKKVKSYIENEVIRRSLGDSIPEILIPIEKVTQLRGAQNKKVIVEKNRFPGYILVNADINNGEVVHLIKSIPGVLGFLGRNGGNVVLPEPLRQSEINRIKGVEEEAKEAAPIIMVAFIKGEEVKVIDGPFSGFIGNVEEINDEKKKLQVAVKIFGRITPVELGFLQVEKQTFEG